MKKIPENILAEAHEFYKTSSLNKTSAWLLKMHNIKISRQLLSPLFKQSGFTVKQTRGTGGNPYLRREEIEELDLKFAKQYIHGKGVGLWRDIEAYVKKKPNRSRIAFLSACTYRFDQLYKLMLESLALNAERRETFDHTTIPEHLQPYKDEIIQGGDDYVFIASFWGLM